MIILTILASGGVRADTIIDYRFDDLLAETGPDTYRIFKHDHGQVGLSQAYKFSGWRSLKIEDVAHDGGFPELQGYFKTVIHGKLYFRFAIMLADINERFNIALAGDSHFRLVNHGIAFWLDNENGYLRHYVNHVPVNLFPLEPFVWYQVDLVYDIDAGRYDLTVNDEYDNGLVALTGQQNAINQAGSSVNKFSFIGDLEDQQNASYYVDDVLLDSQYETDQAEFIAPGRRQLFIDIWNQYHQQLYGKIQCLPGVESADFGIDLDQFGRLLSGPHYAILTRLLHGQPVASGDWQADPILQALFLWQQGCEELLNQEWHQAIDHFSAASELVTGARLYPLSLALAYAGAADYRESDLLMASMHSDWLNEPRLAVAHAMIGISRQAYFRVSQRLAPTALTLFPDEPPAVEADLYADFVNSSMITRLKRYDPENWPGLLEQAVITEQYYFSLLWQQRFHDAFYYAREMISRLTALGIESSKWLERAGDAAFYSKNFPLAIDYYQAALGIAGSCRCNYLKLADIYHLTGDAAREREYREIIYGKFVLSD